MKSVVALIILIIPSFAFAGQKIHIGIYSTSGFHRAHYQPAYYGSRPFSYTSFIRMPPPQKTPPLAYDNNKAAYGYVQSRIIAAKQREVEKQEKAKWQDDQQRRNVIWEQQRNQFARSWIFD